MGWRESFSDMGLLSGDQQAVNRLLLADGIMMVPPATSAVPQVSDDLTDFDEIMVAADIIITEDAHTSVANEDLAG
jgi:hypothetical protein